MGKFSIETASMKITYSGIDSSAVFRYSMGKFDAEEPTRHSTDDYEPMGFRPNPEVEEDEDASTD